MSQGEHLSPITSLGQVDKYVIHGDSKSQQSSWFNHLWFSITPSQLLPSRWRDESRWLHVTHYSTGPSEHYVIHGDSKSQQSSWFNHLWFSITPSQLLPSRWRDESRWLHVTHYSTGPSEHYVIHGDSKSQQISTDLIIFDSPLPPAGLTKMKGWVNVTLCHPLQHWAKWTLCHTW